MYTPNLCNTMNIFTLFRLKHVLNPCLFYPHLVILLKYHPLSDGLERIDTLIKTLAKAVENSLQHWLSFRLDLFCDSFS